MKRVLLSSAIILSSLFIHTPHASADSYVDQVLNETNQLTQDLESYYQNVLVPASVQYDNYLNQLLRACGNGNQSACDEYDVRIGAQNERLDRAIDYMRNRPNPYLPGY